MVSMQVAYVLVYVDDVWKMAIFWELVSCIFCSVFWMLPLNRFFGSLNLKGVCCCYTTRWFFLAYVPGLNNFNHISCFWPLHPILIHQFCSLSLFMLIFLYCIAADLFAIQFLPKPKTCETTFLSLFPLSSTNWCIKMRCIVLVLKLHGLEHDEKGNIYCLQKLFKLHI